MPVHPERKPTRLAVWDYASPGGYFVTICLQQREPRLGTVVDGTLRLTPAGEMVQAAWITNADRYPNVSLDAFIVMPDHLHGIVFVEPDPDDLTSRAGIIRVVQSFKSITTVAYTRGVRSGAYPPFDRVLWQRSFHDHIVRDDRDLDRIREYIAANPARWEAREANEVM